ncbi:MAG TPA: glycosyltransferase family 4 protein [Chloroflexia bacterium]|nr:glycosyltransferase family 4 protein [Chloroflexia bacterium]
MHILLANRWYPPHSGYGGVAMYDYYLAHALSDLGHEVTVVACRWSPSDPAMHLDGPVTVHRILHQDYPRLRRLPGLRYWWRALQQLSYSRQVATQVTAIARSRAVDVVEFAEINAEGYFYSRQLGRSPVVVRCHTPTGVLSRYYTRDEMPYNTTVIAACERHAMRRADALTAPSHDMARTGATLAGVPVDHVSVIPNGLDASEFRPISERVLARPSTATDAFTVLHVGRLERAKGAGVLIAAVPQILQSLPSARVVFVGNSLNDSQGRNWQDRLEGACRAAGVGDRLFFHGYVSQEELLAQYAIAQVVLVPSVLYESFSYTCAQAMACGLPVVASRIGGIPETVLDGESGILITPGDSAELVASVMRLAGDAGMRRRMGQAGRVQAEALFDARNVARQMLAIYERVCGVAVVSAEAVEYA